ncbi:MAG: diguanylate cyclase [Pseudomonadota bacterium]
MSTALPPLLLSRLLDDALDAVMIIDETSRIRYLNGAMEGLCGYASGELLGQPLEGLLPEALNAHHRDYILDYIRGSKASTVLGQVRAFAIRHRCNEMIPIEMKALDLGVVDGARYFGAFMLDLRPRRAMEENNASLMAQLERQALSDTLTQLPNRRAFEQEAVQVMARAVRHAGPVSVGIADVDHFKKVNDQYGHASGDLVLRAVAHAIRDTARTTDMVARLGGEEFGLLLPQATLEQAAQVAERIRCTVAALRLRAEDGRELRVTISIGLAALPAGTRLDGALSNADKALYRAKHNGRDRVETFLPGGPEAGGDFMHFGV